MYRIFLLLILFCGVSYASDDSLRLAVTTSTENSGLLNYLLPDFEQECNCKVRVIVTGSGQAIALGQRGDVDVLLTHSPDDEERFIAEGYGTSRHQVMSNDFVIVGLPSDPARLMSSADIKTALRRLSDSESKFISRNDNSGTHKKEQMLWQTSKIMPRGKWYIQAGAGMGRTLLIADELGAYTLCDRGTYLAFKDKIRLRIVAQKFPLLNNFYSVMSVNAERHPHINQRLARHFVQWLRQAKTQKKIGEYRRFGEALFYPVVNN